MILIDKIAKFEQQIQQEIYVTNYLAFERKKHSDILGALKAELRLAKERYAKELKKVG